ncbi:MAG: hypothetical protein SGBAC_006539 [Bacillariaceae sp.]
MTEQVYQCAKVARSTPSHGIQQRDATDEVIQTQPVKVNSTQAPTPSTHPHQESETLNNHKSSNNHKSNNNSNTDSKSMKDTAAAALRGFMSMGIYVCGPSREDPPQEQDELSLSEESIPQEDEEEEEYQQKIDTTSIEDDYIFEDTSTDDGHIHPRVTIHVITEAKRSHMASPLMPAIDEEEQKEEPSTRLNEDIFEFSDAGTETSSPSMHTQQERTGELVEARTEELKEECKEELKEELKEECKKGCNDEHPQSLDFVDFHFMDDFELVETNFHGSKGYWNAGPTLISPTRFEI